MKISYGDANFKDLRLEGYFYQDRTEYIEKLEKLGSKYSVFLRPRRFGKSLFINMLACYYGVQYKDEFNVLFGDLYIGKNPTPLANQYFVLSFDFSGIKTDKIEEIEQGFVKNVLHTIHVFISTYIDYLQIEEGQVREILQSKSANEALSALLSNIAPSLKDKNIYVLVDEYDHFTNEIVTSNVEYFKEVVARNGFVRKFYEVLKMYAGKGAIGRIFITGITPLTLDSLTSGFNITLSYTLDRRFHNMMGFVESEVTELLRGIAVPEAEIPTIQADLKDWYDGYLFDKEYGDHLYNTDMVLYFATKYVVNNTYPKQMLDNNIASSYDKIKKIFKIGNQEEIHFKDLKSFLETGEKASFLTEQFNLEYDFTSDNLWSMLFYIGMTTIKSVWGNEYTFKMPNYVIKKLYFDYFTQLCLQKDFPPILDKLRIAIKDLVFEANIKPFTQVVEMALTKAHSNRDKMQYSEKHLKTLMLGLLFMYETYLIHSEYEIDSVYPDIFLERIPQAYLRYEIAIELKYVSKRDANKKISENEETTFLEKAVADGTAQINKYMSTERLNRPDVKGFCLVFIANKCKVIIPHANN